MLREPTNVESIRRTEEQKVLLAKTFGCCRFVYNWALNLKIEVYKQEKKSIGNVELTNRSEERTENGT